MKDLNGVFCVLSRISSGNTMSSRGGVQSSSGRKLLTRGEFVAARVTVLGRISIN